MGERYWISGVQLGMLLAYTKDGGMHNQAWEVADEVIDKQFTGNTKTFGMGIIGKPKDASSPQDAPLDENFETTCKKCKGKVVIGIYASEGEVKYNCLECDNEKILKCREDTVSASTNEQDELCKCGHEKDYHANNYELCKILGCYCNKFVAQDESEGVKNVG